jgi:hypothetical protein
MVHNPKRSSALVLRLIVGLALLSWPRIDSAAGTVTLKGTMVSMVTLHFPDGTTARLSETAPYVAHGEDNGTPGVGTDFFSLSVVYTPTPGLDQADLFGINAKFAPFSGAIATGNVVVR